MGTQIDCPLTFSPNCNGRLTNELPLCDASSICNKTWIPSDSVAKNFKRALWLPTASQKLYRTFGWVDVIAPPRLTVTTLLAHQRPPRLLRGACRPRDGHRAPTASLRLRCRNRECACASERLPPSPTDGRSQSPGRRADGGRGVQWVTRCSVVFMFPWQPQPAVTMEWALTFSMDYSLYTVNIFFIYVHFRNKYCWGKNKNKGVIHLRRVWGKQATCVINKLEQARTLNCD